MDWLGVKVLGLLKAVELCFFLFILVHLMAATRCVHCANYIQASIIFLWCAHFLCGFNEWYVCKSENCWNFEGYYVPFPWQLLICILLIASS